MAARARRKQVRERATSAPPATAFAKFPIIGRLLVIFAAAVAVYIPAMSGDFIWDDEPWITANPLVRGDGRTAWQALRAIWTGSETADYYPLTATLNWLQWQLFGANAAAFHITNILLHGGNAVLLWRVLRSIGVPGAWLAAMIFALHPVNAATAAWISETKNTLSLFLYLLALLAFFRFEQTARVRWYIGALALFAAGLLAKTHGVLIPAVLLLYAWWRHGLSALWSDRAEDPREIRAVRISNLVLAVAGLVAAATAAVYLWTLWRRFQLDPADSLGLAANVFVDGRMRLVFPALVVVLVTSACVGLLAAKFSDRANKHVVRALGFFELSALLGTTTVWFHGAISEHIEMGNVARRLANAGSAMWWYVGKLFAPVDLAAVYPPWRFDQPRAFEFVPLVAAIAVFVALWCFRKTPARHALFAFGAYALLVLPLLGFATMAYARGGSLVADHLQYLPSIPLIAGVGAGAAWIWHRCSKLWRGGIAALLGVVLMALASATWARATVYRSEELLWRDTLAKNPATWQGHNRLGQILFARGDFAAAAEHYRRAAVLKPELAPNHNNLGLAYARQERFSEAVSAYRDAIARSPEKAKTTATFRINLANALGAWGNQLEARSGSADEARALYEQAVAEYRAVLAANDRDAVAHRNLGVVLVQLGYTAEAAEHLRATLRLIPREPIASEILAELGYTE